MRTLDARSHKRQGTEKGHPRHNEKGRAPLLSCPIQPPEKKKSPGHSKKYRPFGVCASSSFLCHGVAIYLQRTFSGCASDPNALRHSVRCEANRMIFFSRRIFLDSINGIRLLIYNFVISPGCIRFRIHGKHIGSRLQIGIAKAICALFFPAISNLCFFIGRNRWQVIYLSQGKICQKEHDHETNDHNSCIIPCSDLLTILVID